MSATLSFNHMNFPNFPLYSSLRRDDFKELENEEKDELVEMIKKMNDAEHAILFALITAYHLEHDKHIQDLPYGGKALRSGHKFDVDCLPSKLQFILYSFCHYQKSKESE
jgi:hypothetical protein